MSPSLPSPLGPKQVSHGPTWLHMALQNLQNWNPEIWNIFLRSVGFNFDVKKDTKPIVTIHHSTKTMPGKIHVNITNGIYVNADLTVCIPFLIWHRWPHIGHMALFIMALLSILELNLTEDFSFEFTFSSDAFSVLHSDRLVTQVHMATHGYTWANMAPWPRKIYRIES